jgi:hypothetical protein
VFKPNGSSSLDVRYSILPDPFLRDSYDPHGLRRSREKGSEGAREQEDREQEEALSLQLSAVSKLQPQKLKAECKPRFKCPRFTSHCRRICYAEFIKELCTMHISSPFVVVPVILIVFVVSILYSTSSKEDKPSAH